MVNTKDLLKPTGMKIILSLAVLIPSLVFSLMVTAFTFGDFALLLFVPLGLVISYLIGSYFDYFIKSKNVKIVIASILGFVSIVVGYITLKLLFENTMVCDPVHVPSLCQTTCENIAENVANRTEAAQKFAECMQNCRY